MNRPVSATLLAALVLLAGCAAPTADVPSSDVEASADNASADGGLEIREGSLPIDGNATLERVEALLEVDLDPPAVYVDDSLAVGVSGARDPSTFEATVGLPRPDPADAKGELTVGGIASYFRAVYIIPSEISGEAEVEAVLAHELTHVAQFQERVPQRLEAALPADHRSTTDGRLAMVSLLEGSAVYGSTAYTETYDVDIEPEGELVADLFEEASPGTRLSWGPYHHGYRYVDAHATSPADHWSVYEDPPTTMRDVLAGDSDGDDLEPFEATLEPDAVGWTTVGTDTMGEFVLRTVLETELSHEESADAAAGWAYDRTLRADVPDADLDGHAWTVRFVDEANASTFEASLTEYLDGRADEVDRESTPDSSDGAAENGPVDGRTNATWIAEEYDAVEPYAFAVERVDDRTVTLLAGPEAFVGSASVEPAADFLGATDETDVRIGLEADAADGAADDAPRLDGRFDRTGADSSPVRAGP